MKKLSILIVMWAFCLYGFGQKDIIKDRKIRTYVVEYDFKTRLFPNGNKIKSRVDVPVVFEIKNINRLAYSIDIKSKDSVIGFSDLSGLKLLLEEKEAKKIEDDLNKLETSPELQNNRLPVNSNDFLNYETKKVSKELTKLVNDINQTNVNLLEQLNFKLNELSKITNNENIAINIDSLKIPLSIKEKFPYHFKAQSELAELYLRIVQKRLNLTSLGNDYLEIKTFINNPLLTIADVDEKSGDIKNIHNDFNEHKNSLSDFNLLINRFQNLYNTIKSNLEITENANYGGSIKLFNIANNLNSEVASIKLQVEAIKFDVLKQNIDQIYLLLVKNKDKNDLFEFVSDPIQPYQDVAIFKVKIDKNEKNAFLFYNERDFSYKEFTRHSIRFDLNIGVASSFFNKDNYYEITDQKDASGNDIRKIAETSQSGFSPSFVGFFAVSKRAATHWSYGLSTGLGVSADNGTITLDNFFIAPSLVVGRYERVNLTSGISFKNLAQLKSRFKNEDIVPIGYIIETVTTKSDQTAFFITLPKE